MLFLSPFLCGSGFVRWLISCWKTKSPPLSGRLLAEANRFPFYLEYLYFAMFV